MLQEECTRFIDSTPDLMKAFKDMQRCAMKHEPRRTAMHAAIVIEGLTGKIGLAAWIAAQLDEEF